MGGLILTISPVLIFILLVKHKLVDPIQPHEGFTMSVECFSLKCLSKIITFYISSWLVCNSADIKYLTLICLILLLLNFYSFLSNWVALVLSCSIVTSDLKDFSREFKFIGLTCDSKKCFIHMTNVIASSTPTSSASVELLVLERTSSQPYPGALVVGQTEVQI